MKVIKKFNCVKMVRNIRDNLFEQNKSMNLKDFAKKLVKEAHKSKLWYKARVISSI